MRCMAESNPPAKVWWEKEGVNGIFSPDKEITISPVTRTTAGTYKCVAQNALGMSEPAFVELDVKCKSHHHQTNTAVQAGGHAGLAGRRVVVGMRGIYGWFPQ